MQLFCAVLVCTARWTHGQMVRCSSVESYYAGPVPAPLNCCGIVHKSGRSPTCFSHFCVHAQIYIHSDVSCHWKTWVNLPALHGDLSRWDTFSRIFALHLKTGMAFAVPAALVSPALLWVMVGWVAPLVFVADSSPGQFCSLTHTVSSCFLFDDCSIKCCVLFQLLVIDMFMCVSCCLSLCFVLLVGCNQWTLEPCALDFRFLVRYFVMSFYIAGR